MDRYRSEIAQYAVGGWQHRALCVEPDLRVDEGGRRLSGIAVRYGDTANLGPVREVCAAGSMQTPPDGAQNLTIQHDRGRPVGRLRWVDGPDALRIESDIEEIPRGDEVIADIRAGLLRGLSMEFVPDRFDGPDEKNRVVITRARVLRVSVVDVPAYRGSKFRLREDDAAVEAVRGDWTVLIRC